MRKTKRWEKSVLLLVDICFIYLSYFISYYFRYGTRIPVRYMKSNYVVFILIPIIFLVPFIIFKLYKSLWNYASIDEFILAICACVCAGVLSLLIFRILKVSIPITINVMATVLIAIFTVGLRMSFRIYRRILRLFDKKRLKNAKRVMIVGAGDAGSIILKEMHNSKNLKLEPICFIDDSLKKLGTYIAGTKVFGTRKDIKKTATEEAIDIIIIAIPSLKEEERKEVVRICSDTNCEVKIIPGIYELIDGNVSINNIRNVEVEDLLGRKPIKLDGIEIDKYLKDKTVLVTGGGGSIGSELARQIAKFRPLKLILLDIYENGVYDIQMELEQSYKELHLEIIIASIGDYQSLENLFSKESIDVVFHAAAHKHVPLMENNPGEAVKNNVFGTYNLTQVASKYKVKRFVMISTDKAVNPTNVMGATKRICEMIVQAMDKISQTRFVAVRFGNVLGSNGSVIPLFKKQIAKGGPVTVTHKEITRFFMTIQEAAQLVIQAGAYAKGGEIFLLDMGKSIKIYDLAYDLIRLSGYEPNKDIKIEITGLRKGEKLYEELLMEEEGLEKTKNEKIFIGKPMLYDIEQLQRYFKIIKYVIDNGTEEELIKEIMKLVPTYKRVNCEGDFNKQERNKQDWDKQEIAVSIANGNEKKRE
ncbi:MAG: polysaccharide biosynthesis protein [Clostridiaceae bacterium]